MRILICGAAGFIGSHFAAHFRALGHDVRAAARRTVEARQRLPGYEWIECDFRHDREADWHPRLDGVDAVINCVGVLQDGLGENSRAVHVDGAAALFRACEQAGVRRVIHISAAGADSEAHSSYSDDKLAGETALKALDLDWVILRPSLVIARNTYGGTSLIRALAGLPWISPLVGATQRFRPVMMPDLCAAVEECLAPDAAVRQSFDVGGKTELSMADILRAYRRWLGFGPSWVVDIPASLARPAFWFGDLLGWLGVRTSLRSNSLKQLQYDVAGHPEAWLAQTRIEPKSLDQFLDQSPAGIADKWQARLGFARPVARFILGLFWLVSGLIALSAGRVEALAYLESVGVTAGMGEGVLWSTSLFDIALGLAMLVNWRTGWVAGLMIAGTLAYVAAISVLLPALWAEPLGPVVKVFPGMALALLIAATKDER